MYLKRLDSVCSICPDSLFKNKKELDRGTMNSKFSQYSSVQFSCSVVSDSLHARPGLQHARPPCPSPIPGVYSNSCPLSWWSHPRISSLLSPSLPTFNLCQHQGLFQWVSSSHQVAKVLKLQLQHQSSQYSLGCISGLISFRTDWFDQTHKEILKSFYKSYTDNAEF